MSEKKVFLGIRVPEGTIDQLKALAEKKSQALFGAPGQIEMASVARAAIASYIRREEMPGRSKVETEESIVGG